MSSESYTKVEIIRPKFTPEDWTKKIIQLLITLALTTLLVWWFFTAWLPELGLTYWQLVLPVFVVRQLTLTPFPGRILTD